MKARGVWIQGGVAAASLLAAYATWQREPERKEGDVLILDVTRNDLALVRYQDDHRWIEVTRRKEGGEPAIWMRVSAAAPAPPPAADKAKSPDKDKRPEPPPTPERELRANDQAGKLLEHFAPLRAARALGVLSPEKLKELGLSDTKRRIEVTARGDKRTFAVGSPGAETYLQDERDHRVYLLGRTVASDLDATGSRFIDRTLHAFKLSEVDAMTVAAGGKRRDLVQPHPEGQAPKLADKRSRDKVDETASNWHDKIWRLFPSEVLGKGETPAAGTPSVSLRIDYAGRSGALGWIEVGRTSPPAAPESTPPATGPTPPAAEVWGRTEHTAGWIRLPASAGDLATEGEKVAAGSGT